MEGKNTIYIISGQTNDQQPTFSWENATCYIGHEDDYYHEGVEDTWNFPWIDIKFIFGMIKMMLMMVLMKHLKL